MVYVEIWSVSLNFDSNSSKQHFLGVSRGLQKWSENQCSWELSKILLGVSLLTKKGNQILRIFVESNLPRFYTIQKLPTSFFNLKKNKNSQNDLFLMQILEPLNAKLFFKIACKLFSKISKSVVIPWKWP